MEEAHLGCRVEGKQRAWRAGKETGAQPRESPSAGSTLSQAASRSSPLTLGLGTLARCPPSLQTAHTHPSSTGGLDAHSSQNAPAQPALLTGAAAHRGVCPLRFGLAVTQIRTEYILCSRPGLSQSHLLPSYFCGLVSGPAYALSPFFTKQPGRAFVKGKSEGIWGYMYT